MVRNESIFFDNQAAAGGDLAAFRGPQVRAGRHDARATIGRLRDNATPVGTQSLVNNLYQGMQLDSVTGLNYERFRDYSPSLGTVLGQEPKSRHTAGAVPREISQDPAQYPGAAAHTGSGRSGLRAVEISLFSVEQRSPASSINGANTYQFVESGPVGAVHPTGLAGAGKAADLAILRDEVKSWSSSGYGFAAALLKAFLTQRFVGNAGTAFEKYAGEIKKSLLYRWTAESYLAGFALRHGPGTHILPAHKILFDVEYYFGGDFHLFFALGGAHFGFKSGKIVVRCAHGFAAFISGTIYDWKTENLKVYQKDTYAFPPGIFGYRLLDSAYAAASDLQVNHLFQGFTHEETWADSFSGTVPPLGMSGPP